MVNEDLGIKSEETQYSFDTIVQQYIQECEKAPECYKCDDIYCWRRNIDLNQFIDPWDLLDDT